MASASGALAASVAFSASGIGRSAIALRPVPSAADCVIPPDSTPTASPSSKPNTADTPMTVASPLTATMSASAICGRASFFRLPKNCGPDRIADREQEQVEERPSQQVWQFRLGENADGHAGDQRADHGAEPHALDVEAADERPEQDAQEQAQHRDSVQERRKSSRSRSAPPLHDSRQQYRRRDFANSAPLLGVTRPPARRRRPRSSARAGIGVKHPDC